MLVNKTHSCLSGRNEYNFMESVMSTRLKTILIIILGFVGLSILLYPTVSNALNADEQYLQDA